MPRLKILMEKGDQSIKKKALAGLGSLTVILGMSLFIPAGTLDYWQAWVYLFIFSGSSLAITLFLMQRDMELLKRRLTGGAAAEKERSQKIIQKFARFIFIGVLLIPGFDHRFNWSQVSVFLVLTGEIFVALGFFIVFLVFRENSYTSAIIEIAENQQVISTGPYAVVRHPMYSGALLLLLFTPPALGSFWGLPFVILIFIVIIWRLLEEEKFLSKNLSGYPAYCQKTRFRLIPMIW
jgi:protein-S-isoprenylcysteine O-methyltransferase Ste14